MPKEAADWNFRPDRVATQSEGTSNGCVNLVIRLRAGNRASSTETVRRGMEVTCLQLGNLSRLSVGMYADFFDDLLFTGWFLIFDFDN
ncbi:hypothetical protein NPIL_355801 [Nephila pilipes]|uniref:Uncharacterized protein n=1 Tax=Nephila pilipes TaxID=299642 RepID=A0A8X6THM6_NEPPI|nr:hypothetical protein NPIL_355801 [Nephila pilipes]